MKIDPRRKGARIEKKKSSPRKGNNSLREVSLHYNGEIKNPKSEINPSMQSIWPSIVEYVGLSEYEAKIYLGLVSLGAAGARRLSLNCDVPRTKVYGTLKKLIDYGLVVEVPGSPKKFMATDPRVAFSTLLELQKLQAQDFSDLMTKVGEEYDHAVNKREPEVIHSWLIEDSDDVLEKCIEFIRNTSKVLTITTDPNGLETLFNSVGNDLDNLASQGASIRIFSPLDPETNSLAREMNYVHDVKMKVITSPLMLINSDNSKYMIAKTMPRESDRLFKFGVFGESPDLMDLIDLLVSISDNETIRLPITSL